VETAIREAVSTAEQLRPLSTSEPDRDNAEQKQSRPTGAQGEDIKSPERGGPERIPCCHARWCAVWVCLARLCFNVNFSSVFIVSAPSWFSPQKKPRPTAKSWV